MGADEVGESPIKLNFAEVVSPTHHYFKNCGSQVKVVSARVGDLYLDD
jgi:hypothetical protein